MINITQCNEQRRVTLNDTTVSNQRQYENRLNGRFIIA